jgi:hypothetical protein
MKATGGLAKAGRGLFDGEPARKTRGTGTRKP